MLIIFRLIKRRHLTCFSITCHWNRLGDVNLDGEVDLSDAVLLNKAVAGAVQLNEQATLNADCNRGVGITADDSMSLLKFLVHLIDALPE